ncbi:SRPBCC domain-containing protein [Micromonospora siamensis]|uniref:Uncharacterized conserved protein YndB, AHSA1/START domain n=1 Tax=Micromonospora siamensis TaxID=299152 RepID=A0A1C5J6B0_9ACTN|nr:SRPBCC domain-containing protein [Micromonospora siamensis]SCG66087.1 Uncharacterized conserved protein YndB, AHSA1/START domain [Micromonospora siamensis]
MTDNAQGVARILGTLGSTDGKGVVRMQDRLDSPLDDVWTALTEPERLARWLGTVEGDFVLGGELRAQFFDGWEGTGRVEVCEPRQRVLVVTRHHRQSYEQATEITLAADGDGTVLVWEERGMSMEHVAPYGAGVQVHVEDLAGYLAGRERGDGEARWKELFPAYEELAAKLG